MTQCRFRTVKKPTDLNLHCLQRQGISGFSRTRVNKYDTKMSSELKTVSFVKGLSASFWEIRLGLNQYM